MIIRPCRSGGDLAMGQLADNIVRLIAQGRYFVGVHAANRLDEREIEEWHIVAGALDGEVISERGSTRPNPTIEMDQSLPDGTRCKAVWAHVERNDIAKLVTVHFYDP